MLNLEELFASFIDQLSQRHSDGVGLISLRSRRIQRSLRFIEAAQGGCWTAPCSPAVPTFGEELSRQSKDLVIHDACQARVQSRHNSLLPAVSQVLEFLESGGRQADRQFSLPPSPQWTKRRRKRPISPLYTDTARRPVNSPSKTSPTLLTPPMRSQ